MCLLRTESGLTFSQVNAYSAYDVSSNRSRSMQQHWPHRCTSVLTTAALLHPQLPIPQSHVQRQNSNLYHPQLPFAATLLTTAAICQAVCLSWIVLATSNFNSFGFMRVFLIPSSEVCHLNVAFEEIFQNKTNIPVTSFFSSGLFGCTFSSHCNSYPKTTTVFFLLQCIMQIIHAHNWLFL